MDIGWRDEDSLRFQYDYAVLPEAIISRFIVKLRRFIENQLYWKNGVYLADRENRAKVKADPIDRKIFISVIGKPQTRRAFLAVIRAAFEAINEPFAKNIEITRWVPAPDDHNVLISYDELLIYEEENRPNYYVTKLRKEYSVRTLLNSYESYEERLERLERDEDGFPRPAERRRSKLMDEEIIPKPQPPAPPPKNNPLGSLMSFVFGFVILLGAIVGAAVVISKWVSVTAGVMTSVIIIGALLAIGVIGAMGLRNDDRLSDESFLKLMIEAYRRLPLLRGGDSAEKALENKEEA